MTLKKLTQAILATSLLATSVCTAADRPNVLFIAVDDLNDWIGCMGGNEQSITPNFDRLAASGMLFTNAHCVAPACNPSRTAVMTGRSTHKTGVYDNGQNMRDVLPDEQILPEYFAKHGYWSGGSGKMLHYFTDARSWDEYFPEKSKEMPIPDTYYPSKRPVSLERAGPWQYVETDWGPMPVEGKEFGGDYTVSEWVGNQLSKQHDKPFFLACGIYRPHEPWFVPQKYFDKFPLEDIKLPPAYKEADLDDLPEAGKITGRNRYFAHIQKQDQWKQGVQGYLASINYADTMLGRVLDALENGPNKDNTIVVLWSDHGWHLGSKEHWQKYTAWRACTRIPLMIKVPEHCSPALPQGIKPGSISDQPVSLISLFPTLTELCGLPAKPLVDGKSIAPMLKDPSQEVDPVAITYLHRVGSIGISGKDWRYIRYQDDSEELYDISKDPYEWDNLASNPDFTVKLEEFRKHIPKHFAPKPKVKVVDLPALKWHPYKQGSKTPASKVDGGNMRLAFVNRLKQPVKIHRVSKDGTLVEKAKLKSGKVIELKSAPGTSWAITTTKGNKLGHFVHGDRDAKAVIRKSTEE
ncbi:Arylsulfatase A [Rubritalea squalenifaciens DSM 18772]|uniref:Arylsulfatase A n=1 Tax=Rubritalea squalenifaciens DSM 18772 TaxID=1123071 RepID=A0A1M6MBY9_9BACT|nr:sulfatase [Rubritalea squalenifaciens]SHJ80880.1 Arylsulfatase A [Rubritalea squalenifaciens DSM 18772]